MYWYRFWSDDRSWTRYCRSAPWHHLVRCQKSSAPATAGAVSHNQNPARRIHKIAPKSKIDEGIIYCEPYINLKFVSSTHKNKCMKPTVGSFLRPFPKPIHPAPYAHICPSILATGHVDLLQVLDSDAWEKRWEKLYKKQQNTMCIWVWINTY